MYPSDKEGGLQEELQWYLGGVVKQIYDLTYIYTYYHIVMIIIEIDRNKI
jgi:hypothetical protein